MATRIVPTLTIEQAREIFHYDPDTGVFTWRQAGRNRLAGAVAGSQDHRGYIQISIGPRGARIRLHAHRLAWFYVHGEWPEVDVDHRDHDKSNNRIKNLRPLTRSVNQQNQIKAHRNNGTGLLGVFPRKGRFVAVLHVHGRQKWVGTFNTPEEAHLAYVEAKRELHPGCTL